MYKTLQQKGQKEDGATLFLKEIWYGVCIYKLRGKEMLGGLKKRNIRKT